MNPIRRFTPSKGVGAASFQNATIASVNPRSMRLALWPAVLLLAALPAYAFGGGKTRADEKAGAVLFQGKGCAHCHGAGGSGGKKGPDLTNIRKNKLWTPPRITNQILNGGQKMPPFSDSLTDPEIAQVVAYLRAKHRPAPPPVVPSPAN
jgi:mono/diheme cytochrome c family protein